VTAVVIAVSCSGSHSMSKPAQGTIKLLAGLGVEGDAHLGKTDQHLYHMKKDPTRVNLRQVHLIHSELHEELRASGFELAPGEMGENVTTSGIDLLGLPTGTRLHLGDAAIIEVTGLRNPCHQLNKVRPGLMAATLDKDADGNLIRKAGVMAIVVEGGAVRAGDSIDIELPATPHQKLKPV
jgi:MOSC domain-containing protein YiiM